ncbi:MAG TPA: dihydrodipicolinate synthase family protein [Bryobacteraceae bacterium]|nr:dihydrodipicolinate synthase family protein [Bryobacteraceae bacterium]
MSSDTAIGGVYVAAVTPHRDKSYEADVGATLELVDFLAAAGVDGIALLGSTGEFLHLAFDDRIRLVQLVAKRTRVPVLVGVAHSTLDGALELGREAAAAGAAGLLLMPPYFFRYSQEDIHEFYLQFAAAMDKTARIFLYNIPAFTNEIAIDTATALLGTGLFAGIKDSGGQYGYFERLLAVSKETPFTLMVGNDRIYSRARQTGAHGIVSGVACAAPELLVALEDAIAKNLTAKVERLDTLLREFIDWHDKFPTPVAIKTAASERGLKIGPLASPLSLASQKLLDQFREWFLAWLPLVQREASADVLK